MLSECSDAFEYVGRDISQSPAIPTSRRMVSKCFGPEKVYLWIALLQSTRGPYPSQMWNGFSTSLPYRSVTCSFQNAENNLLSAE